MTITRISLLTVMMTITRISLSCYCYNVNNKVLRKMHIN